MFYFSFMDFMFHLILFLNFIVESTAGPRPSLHNCRQIRARLRSPDHDPAPPAQVPVRVALGRSMSPSPLWGQSSDLAFSPGEWMRGSRPPVMWLTPVGCCTWGRRTHPGVHPASLLHAPQQWRRWVRRALTGDPVTRSRSGNVPVSDPSTAVPNPFRPQPPPSVRAR